MEPFSLLKNFKHIEKFINYKSLTSCILCCCLSCVVYFGTYVHPDPALADELSPADNYPVCTDCNGNYQYKSYNCLQTETRLFENKRYECQAIHSINLLINTSSTNTNQHAKNQCWSKFIGSDLGSANYENGSEVFSGLVLERKIELFNGSLVNDWKKPCKPIDDQPQTCVLDIEGMIKNAFKYRFPMDLLGDNPIGETNPTCPVMTIQDQSFEMCYLVNLAKGLKYPILLIFVLKTLTNI